MRSLADAALRALRREHSDRCVVFIGDHSLWPQGVGLVCQLTKAGISTGVDRSWWLLFGDAHTRPLPDDGKFLLLPARDAVRFDGAAGVVRVAESAAPAMALLWRPANTETVGDYFAADLAFFTLENEGFCGGEIDGDDAFCWSDGPSSRLVVKLAGGRAYRLTLRAAPFFISGRVQDVTVLLNGQPLGEIRLDDNLPKETILALPGRW